jgi:hypothetical protein
LAYTEALPDETARTAIAFTHRARLFFARHGITHIHRLVTDNGACYRARDFATVLRGARHQRITPYTPRHNGKIERYNRILAEEFLYARVWTSEQHRSAALHVWNVHYNYHRPHTAAGNQPPATRLHTSIMSFPLCRGAPRQPSPTSSAQNPDPPTHTITGVTLRNQFGHSDVGLVIRSERQRRLASTGAPGSLRSEPFAKEAPG